MSTMRSGNIHKRIDDAWLTANAGDKNAVTDCQQCQLDDNVVDHDSYKDIRMLPLGIIFSKDNNGANTTTAQQIRGILMDEGSAQADDYTLAPNVIHPIAFKRIYAQGTTAKGIKVVGERQR